MSYTLKFDARWARLAQVVNAGDVKIYDKISTVETDYFNGYIVGMTRQYSAINKAVYYGNGFYFQA